MYLAVAKVKPSDDYKLELIFKNDEVIRVFDMKLYLDIGAYKEQKNGNKFKSVKISFDSIE